LSRATSRDNTKFDDSGWGFAPDPAEGAYSTPQTLWLDLRGPTFFLLALLVNSIISKAFN